MKVKYFLISSIGILSFTGLLIFIYNKWGDDGINIMVGIMMIVGLIMFLSSLLEHIFETDEVER